MTGRLPRRLRRAEATPAAPILWARNR